MRYLFKNNRWLSFMSSKLSDDRLLTLLDTGAQSTALRIETVAKLKGWKVIELKKYLSDKQTIILGSASGHIIKGVPCNLQDITVAGELVKNLFCIVPIEQNTLSINLIGADMINACTTVTKDDSSFILSGLDERKYATYFRSRCSSIVPTWLCSVETNLLVDDIVDLKVFAPNCVEWANRHNYNKEAFRLALFKVIDKHRITTLEALEAIITEIDK